MASNEQESNAGAPVALELAPKESTETSLSEQAAESVAELARLALASTKAAFQRARRTVTRPSSGAAFAGATVIGLSSVFGIPATAVGVSAVYVAYRAVRRKRVKD